jgi:hypothetical protein
MSTTRITFPRRRQHRENIIRGVDNNAEKKERQTWFFGVVGINADNFFALLSTTRKSDPHCRQQWGSFFCFVVYYAEK